MHRYAPTPRQMLWGVLGAFLLLILFVGLGYAFTSIPSPNSFATNQTTLLYYSDGKTVLARLGATNRTSIPLSQVPVPVQHAVLSAEDRNFESEPGISPTGILRALFVDLKGGDVQQGGSTITQQYVKNAYLTQQRTFTRKFKEIFIAVKLGNSKPKAEILQDYLNTIYFGRNAYGIEAASEAYFHVHASQLNVAEGALLAAVIRAPGLYDPAIDAAAAKARWQYVIDGMVKKHWLSAADAAKLAFPTKQLKTGEAQSSNTDCVKDVFFICKAVEAELNNAGIDEGRLRVGGYRIVTTITRTAQRAMEGAMRDEHGGYQTSGADKGREAAMVSVQPGDGAIRAMYGGSGGCTDNTLPDNCTDLSGVTGMFSGQGDYTRSPGSSFKPYTLITALQQGIGLDSRFHGPSHIDFPGTNGKGINNSGGESCGTCTLTQALARSVNTIFVPLAQKVGPDQIAQVAHDAGVQKRHHLDAVPTITLGTSDVAPIDQATGYATIAAQGVMAKPYLVNSVKSSSGATVYRAHRSMKRVFAADVMADTTYAMTKVFDCSIQATACGRSLPGRPAAGKTGTNGQGNDNFDAWFIGFTPQLSTAVWFGNADRKKPVTNHGSPMFGSDAALAWQQMMTTTLAGQPVESFPPPAHVGSALNASPTATPSSSPTSPSPSSSPSLTISPTLTPTTRPTHSLPGSPTSSPTPTSTTTAAGSAPPG
ncbi:MAG TPA: transglycosylase domain-containing protein [Mycobacteriales bacterium]|nr:transglycosylase domain-containing protein [Mycobacteriales bacterium]